MIKTDIPDFSQAHVVIVGDVMLDQYWEGTADRISPEAPVPVVHINQQHARPGGAGNVALNLRALGAQVTLLGWVGDDANAELLKQALSQAGVQCLFFAIPGLPTITKLRVMGHHQQLIRLDFEQSYQDIEMPSTWFAQYQQALASADAVILSDYGKGTLNHAPAFIAAAKAQGAPVFVDPKRQDFAHYAGATLITPNQKEFEAVIGQGRLTEQALVDHGQSLIENHELGGLLITLGAKGMRLLPPQPAPVVALSAHVREVYDVTGAGDTVIAVLAASIAMGESWAVAAELANLAAGIVVGKLGAATASPAQLRRALQRRSNSELGILTLERLPTTLIDARAHGETIVMTNGCFDLLHAGHIEYLRQAKALGHRLLVAVNTDDSVKRLKGKTRPINPLNQRMAVLAALRYVDWVISFSEDTPAALIEQVKPDFLVKGGDYQAKEIVGYDTVIQSGGQVKILDFVPGCSTTHTVKKIQINPDIQVKAEEKS